MPFLVLPFPAFDPVLITIGPFAIRWYALSYIAGILLGWFYARDADPATSACGADRRRSRPSTSTTSCCG